MTPAPDIVKDETIPPGGYWTRILDRFERLRIVDVDGRQSCSLLAYNADQTSERFNAPDTVKIQNQIFLTTGRVLFSDLGRVLFSIVDDTKGSHDALAGFGDAALDASRYAPGSYRELHNDFHRNARDNFVMALGRHGLGRRDPVMSFNPFARVRVAPEGAFRCWPRSSAVHKKTSAESPQRTQRSRRPRVPDSLSPSSAFSALERLRRRTLRSLLTPVLHRSL